MHFNKDDKVALFIDGPNIHSAARGLSMELDYSKLLNFFATKSRLVRAYYYTALLEDGEYTPLKNLVDWLTYNGYRVVAKTSKEFFDANGLRRVKSNISLDLAVDAMELAEKIDHAVLFSGDGDYTRLVDALQRAGVRVTVVSTTKTKPPMAADLLRRQADGFIDLEDLKDDLSR